MIRKGKGTIDLFQLMIILKLYFHYIYLRKSSKTRSDSSASSYSSSSDDDGSKSGSDSEIDSYSDEDQGKKKKSSNHQARASMKASLKRAGEDLKNLIESKKSKPSTSPTSIIYFYKYLKYSIRIKSLFIIIF